MRDRRLRLALIAGLAVLGGTLAGCSDNPPTTTTTTTEETTTKPVLTAPAPAPMVAPGAPSAVTTTTTHSETQQVNQ